MTTRTDVHSPANLVTEDYEYVYTGDNYPEDGLGGFFGLPQSSEAWLDWVRDINAGLNRSPLSDRGHYQCHHCGANLRYAAILKHVPTGAYIAVGETCLENRFERATADFHVLRKQAQLDREQQRIKKAVSEFLATVDPDIHDCLVKADPTEFVNVYSQAARDHHIVSDIRHKLHTYGTLSVAQVNLVGKIILQQQEAEVRQAKRDAEVKVPAPVGRVTFTGTVVSRKFKDNEFGGGFKLTIKVTTEAGVWLAWLSEPKSFGTEKLWGPRLANGSIRDDGWQAGVDIGDVVTLTATLEHGDTPSFAFGKRPTKASIVSRATA